MDIFKYAEEWGVDYYDPHTGNIYHCQAYIQDKKAGLPVEGIPVTFPDGSKGMVYEKNNQ